MRNYLIVFSLFIPFFGFGQRERLDSLLRTERFIKEDTNGAKHLLITGKLFKKINPDSSSLYLDHSFRLSSKINSHPYILKTYFERVSLIRASGDIKKLVDTLKVAHQLALKYNESLFISRFSLDLGVAYRRIGDYNKSIRHLLEALEIAQKNNYRTDVYNSLNSLANTYSQAGLIKKSPVDLNRALEYYEKAYQVVDKTNKGVVAMVQNNQGVTYYNLGQIKKDSNDTKKSIEYYKKALQLRSEVNDSSGVASDYNNIGSAYHDLCENFKSYQYLDDALENYQKAVDIDKKINSPDKYSNLANYAGHLAYVGKFRNDKKMIQNGVILLKEALQTSLQNRDLHITMTIYESLNYCFEALKIPDSALVYLHNYIMVKDTLLTDENKQVAEELATKYESDLKDTENKNLKQQADLREEVISRKSNTIKIMIAASVIMLILIVMVFISRQKITKSRELIKKQKQETEEQKLLIEEKQKEILDSINYSKRLQDAAIPSTDYFKSLLPESFIYYKPKDIVAGDFYWIHAVKRDSLNVKGSEPITTPITNGPQLILVAAADCTGHGVPGALVSIVCLNALNRCIDEFNLSEPSKILDKAAEIIQQSFRQSENDVKDGMDIALCLLDLENKKGFFSGANNPVWILSGTHVKEIKGDNQPVGQQHIPKPFSEHEFELHAGDTILLCTDGYADQFGGPNGKKLKTKNFKEIFPEMNSKPITDVHKKIETFFIDWKGTHEQVDDVLVIGIRI
ncbi:MAG: protein serine/threonine phosphatase [Bacteroidetes bacterium]|jgi:serine phosphatase RsbU (regulator of sigma subunit)|nr:protein serine/threonine phosphatase [Bacteroidota bacterium]